LASAVDASRLQFEQQHELTLALPGHAIYVDGDPIRLEQILMNLLENEAKYTKPGGKVHLSLEHRAGEAILSLRDDGIGLAPDTLENIFDLFTQINGSLAQSGGGLGIGLNLVRRLLELHGGRIQAHSPGLGKGTEFVDRMPGGMQRTRSQSSQDAQILVPLASTALRARRLLIVDDNQDSAESMMMLAQSWGHEAMVANDGPSALKIALPFAPDMALVDIGLPGMDGYEVARRLRKASPDRELYLMALTGYGSEDDIRLAHAAGFDKHVVKPADLETLRVMMA
jgi:CheY-like chemotaxis protein